MPRAARPRHEAASLPVPALCLIGIAALVIRLLYLASVRGAPFVQTLQTNPERYHTWACLILDGRAPTPPFDQSPAYAYLVALVYAVAGRSPAAVGVVQAGLDALTCVAIALAELRLASAAQGRRRRRAAAAKSPNRPAVIAGLLAAVYGPFIYFTGELLPASVTLCAIATATTAALFGRWWGTGALWAVATVFRTESLLGLPVLLAAASNDGGRRSMIAVGAPSLVAVLLLIGVTGATGGSWGLPNSGSGLNLWLGNNPHADGVSPFVSGESRSEAERFREQSNHDVRQADGVFRGRAVAYWSEYPVQALRLAWKKLRWTFSDRELPNTSDIEWQESYSWMFRLPGVPLHLGVVLILALAALPGLYAQRRALLPLAAGPCVAILTCTLFFTNARFRLPLAPPLLVLAAGSLDRLWEFLPRRRRHGRKLAAMGLAGGLGAWLAYSDPYNVASYRIPQLDVNTGIAEREAGHFDRAAEYLRRGLQATPDDEIAWVHLALALEQRGDLAGAAGAYLDGLAAAPGGRNLPDMTRRFFDRQRLDPHDLESYLATTSAPLRAAIAKAVIAHLEPRR